MKFFKKCAEKSKGLISTRIKGEAQTSTEEEVPEEPEEVPLMILELVLTEKIWPHQLLEKITFTELIKQRVSKKTKIKKTKIKRSDIYILFLIIGRQNSHG